MAYCNCGMEISAPAEVCGDCAYRDYLNALTLGDVLGALMKPAYPTMLARRLDEARIKVLFEGGRLPGCTAREDQLTDAFDRMFAA